MVDATFGKSLANRRVERGGLDQLLLDDRFHALDAGTKREVAKRFGFAAEFGTRAFDAVMCEGADGPVELNNLDQHAPHLRLVEMKTTQATVVDEDLGGFFFGITEREFALAERLGDRYLFAFVVLNSVNRYGRPFWVLLTRSELESRIASKRVQYQVTLRPPEVSGSHFGVGPVLRPPVVLEAT